jgi:hypothetical protein
MTMPTPAERTLYSELTQIFVAMRQAPLAEVHAAIEERFRRYLEDECRPSSGDLQITLTWSLPEGADGLALYRTEYDVEGVAPVGSRPVEAVAGRASAQIIRFPLP